MFWNQDEWDEAYDEVCFEPDEEYEDEEEEDENAMYFDVDRPYRPLQRRKL